MTQPLHHAIQSQFTAQAFLRLAKHASLSPQAIARSLSQPVSRPQWLAALRIRRHAIYLAVTALNLHQAELAHALGLKRQTVHRLVHLVENERDDPSTDAILDLITQEITP